MSAVNIKTTKKVNPQCYAYTTPEIKRHDGWTKIGYTERDVEERIKEQLHTAGVDHITHWAMRAAFITPEYENFTDRDFHAYLKKLGVEREADTEWFKIDPKEAESKYLDFAKNYGIIGKEDNIEASPYKLRDEQEEAVKRALEYFKSHREGEFLWNAKPRFGKTLSAYDLCMKLGARNILILTNRPAIANSWYEDYVNFFGPGSGYYFVSNIDALKNKKYVLSRGQYIEETKRKEDDVKGCIEFVSLQDLKGSVYFGGDIDKLFEISKASNFEWDVMIIDEAHEGVDTYKTETAFYNIKRKNTLHLSGTPFKALANEKFKEEAIYNWTYADEQKKKREWDSSSEAENSYEALPRLNLYTYQMSDIVRDKLKKGIELADSETAEYAFDLNEFFATDANGKFIHEADVDKFLDALAKQEKFPFSTPELRNELKHTFWLLNYVASAKALAKKLEVHSVFKDYKIILAAGDGKLDDDDENIKSYDAVVKAVKEYDKTITLSVGQLTTGVTVPEWTAVLMLSNMSSPSLYMQAAFRAQNPFRFKDNEGDYYRKENAYVFDFDPARTLTIFEQFANDLIPENAGEKGDFDSRKNNVRELLNFFPVYAEDENGAMIKLDAEKVLTIPRRIHAKEVVERGFMSNFLFADISGIFSAPKEIIDIINNIQAIEQPKSLAPAAINEDARNALSLNENNEIEIPAGRVIGLADDIFGEKIYGDVETQITADVENIIKTAESNPNPERDELIKLQRILVKPISDALMGAAKKNYGKDFSKSVQNQVERKITDTAKAAVNEEYGKYKIRDNIIKKERDEAVKEAQKADAPMEVITEIDKKYEAERIAARKEMAEGIKEKLIGEQTVKKAGEMLVETVETEKRKAEKDSVEGSVRDRLKGFSRTVPAFLMAYGDENTTLADFDKLVPEDVFWEVTVNPGSGEGVTLDQFRMLRDGGDYKTENGEIKHFDGHLFDEVVFNDAVREFMKKRSELADYFSPDKTEDIFDYIPPQRTNQIFTPKTVVKDMADKLEEENPGCFNDPEATFADLYMKSGMYITEIVRRLYQSEELKRLYPDGGERLNHIFAKQVYGCAPTEIIYRICRRYILGFSEDIKIDKDNIRLCDTLQFAKNGDTEEKLKEVFGL